MIDFDLILGGLLKRCVIHVGLAKTGSTSIQQSFYTMTQRKGFCYIDSGEYNIARFAAICFKADAENYRPLKRLGLSRNEIEQRRGELLSKVATQFSGDYDTWLMSTELFTGFDAGTISALSKWVRGYVDRVELIGYLRPIHGYLESMFAQSFKNGNGKFDISSKYPRFRERIEKLDSIFGRDAVTFRNFDRRQLHDGCVVRDLAQAVGVNLRSDEVRNVNDSLSRESSSLLFIYRKFGAAYGKGPGAIKDNIRIVRRLSALEGPKLRLATTLVHDVVQANMADLQWAEERTGISLLQEGATESAFAVGCEEDLLTVNEKTLAWLCEKAKCEPTLEREVKSGDLKSIATAVRKLREG